MKPVISVEPIQLTLPLPPSLQLVPTQADTVQALRHATGLTQAELGALVGIKQPHIANVERGHDALSNHRLRALRYYAERIAA